MRKDDFRGNHVHFYEIGYHLYTMTWQSTRPAILPIESIGKNQFNRSSIKAVEAISAIRL